MPSIADNALVKMVPLVERAAAFRPQPRIEPEVEAFMQLREMLIRKSQAEPVAARLSQDLVDRLRQVQVVVELV